MSAAHRAIPPFISAPGISGQNSIPAMTIYITAVQSFPYQRAEYTFPVHCSTRAPSAARLSSRTICSPISSHAAFVRVAAQSIMAIWISLSAAGSSALPRSVTILKRRAIAPSSTSDTAHSSSTPIACQSAPLTYSTAKTGVSSILTMLIMLGMFMLSAPRSSFPSPRISYAQVKAAFRRSPKFALYS